MRPAHTPVLCLLTLLGACDEVPPTNPHDPDQTDLRGSDVDTHFLKMPNGRWFEAPYDNYFGNRTPFFVEILHSVGKFAQGLGTEECNTN